jgi:hypothetical protein
MKIYLVKYLLMLSNAVNWLRRDISILFNRLAIVSLIYCILQGTVSLSFVNKGLGLHGGLLHITSMTQIFHIFIYMISMLILKKTSFNPRIFLIPRFSWFKEYNISNINTYLWVNNKNITLIILLFIFMNKEWLSMGTILVQVLFNN